MPEKYQSVKKIINTWFIIQNLYFILLYTALKSIILNVATKAARTLNFSKMIVSERSHNVNILLGTVLKGDPLTNFLQRIIFAGI